MKSLFILAALIAVTTTANAQNVGIGTNLPNVDALLDISSTTKGVLFPRMTTIQRISINTPPNGLMVFDTDRNELYQYIASTFSWRTLINDSYWRRQSLTRSRIGNSSDSVGIGTLSPTEWLDVDGNIRTRNTLLADNNVVATGVVSAGTLNSSGSLFVSGTSSLNGNVTANSSITTNGDMIVNNSGATLQLKAAGADKAFFQLSGDNLRLGTNSGNVNGQIILRSRGIDRLTVFENGNINIGSSAANAAKLRVSGDISVQDNIIVQDNVNVGGKVTRSNLNNNKDFLPICFGKVAEDGSVISGSGNFTVSTTPGLPGIYEITSSAINSSVVFVGTIAQFGGTLWMKYESGNKVKVYCNALFNGSASNTPFSFVMYKGD